MSIVNCADCGKQIDLDVEDNYSSSDDNSYLCEDCSDKNDILETDAKIGGEYWEGKL